MKKVSFLLPVVFCYMISCQDKQVVADLEAYKSQAEIEKLNKSVVQGIHNGPLGDIPPTGNEVTLGIFTVFRLVDGKIAEEWELMEELAMMIQLGFEIVPSSK